MSPCRGLPAIPADRGRAGCSTEFRYTEGRRTGGTATGTAHAVIEVPARIAYIACTMSMQYTIRAVPDTIDRAVRQRARRESKTLNAVVVRSTRPWTGTGRRARRAHGSGPPDRHVAGGPGVRPARSPPSSASMTMRGNEHCARYQRVQRFHARRRHTRRNRPCGSFRCHPSHCAGRASRGVCRRQPGISQRRQPPTVPEQSPRPPSSCLTSLTTHHYAQLYLQLRSKGAPIPTNDLWIASITVQHSLVLCTSDQHFRRIPQVVTC